MERNYSVALNLARGLSAQLVLFGHSIAILGLFKWFQPPTFPYIQNVGVVVFFIISGGVITYVIRANPVSIEEFIFDRATRIFTALVPALVLVAIADFFCAGPQYEGYETSIKIFVGNLLMMASYPKFGYFGTEFDFSLMRVPPFGSLRPIWTVAVEWWLYVFFGAIFLAPKLQLTWGRIGSFALVLMSVPVAFNNVFGGTGQGLALVWLFGAAYYRFIIEEKLLHGRPWLNVGMLCFTVLLIGFSRSLMATWPFFDLRYSIFICAIIIFGAEIMRDFCARILPSVDGIAAFLAKYSYSLYLLHFTIVINLYSLIDDGASVATKIGALACGLIASNAAAYLFWLAFESRYRDVRTVAQRWFRRGMGPRHISAVGIPAADASGNNIPAARSKRQ